MTTPRVPPATGIVLAGGRSSRFGRDKLIEPVDGRPLVQHAIAAVAEVCAEVLVIVPPVGDPPPLPGPGATPVPVLVVRDPEPHGGPLVGLLAGLERAGLPLALLAAGDMPRLATPVLRALLRALESGDADAAVLVRRGRREPFPAALRVGRATDAATRLLADGERRLGAVFETLLVEAFAESDWRVFDPTSDTLLDVDRPEDLG